MARYVTGIDDTICALLEKNRTMGYNELWKAVNSEYQKTSLGSFDYHIKRLQSGNVITKEDSGLRGKRVHYYLSTEAKKEMALKILNNIPESKKSDFLLRQEENRRLMLFFVLFLFDTYPVQFSLKEEQIESFLSKFGVRLGNLVVKDNDSLIYENVSDGSRSDTINYTYYDVPTNKIKFYDPTYREFVTFYKSVGSPLDALSTEISYNYELPGVSISDILNSSQRPTLEHVNFTKDETEEIIHLAIKQRLLKPIMEFDNEIRYGVASSNLRRFFSDLDDLYESIKYKIVVTWTFHRRPTKDEIKWMNLFEGMKRTQELRDIAYHKRHTLNLKTRKESLQDIIRPQEMNIKENLDKVRKKHSKVIRKYDLPITKLLMFVYPPYIHTSRENYKLLISTN